jgi:hypothetical protein
MTTITCAGVREQLELFALGECDARTQRAIDKHLADCPACAAELAEVRQLIDLVDLHEQAPDRLERLHDILADEARPREIRRLRSRLVRFPRQVAALAAALLLTLGLTRLAGPLAEDGDTWGVTLVVAGRRDMGEAIGKVPEANGAAEKVALAMKQGDRTLHYRLDLGGVSPAAFRRRLQEAEGTDRLPPPPKVDLTLALHNRSARSVEIQVGAEESELTLDLRGPGAVTVRTRDPLGQPFLTRQRVRVEPGGSFFLPLPRLVFGAPGNVRYAYWTEPGHYTLTITYRAVVTPSPRQAVSPEGLSLAIEVQAP